MLDITNIVSVSVSENPVGLGEYNINNLALFSNEVPLDNDLSSSSSSSGAGEYVPGPYGTYRSYVSPAEVAADWGTSSETYAQALAVFGQQPNILAGGGNLIIFTMSPDETLAQAIARTVDDVFYCGIISTAYPDQADMLALATAVQAYKDKILFLPTATASLITGAFTDIKNSSLSRTRCLYYSTSEYTARLFAAAAAGRSLSVDFNGSNTALTMNLKQLAGITADSAITQTIYDLCETAGVDVYVSFAGVSAYVSNGANRYFDEAYNLVWFISALRVAGFNALFQTGNKVPQTEVGMNLLKSAYRSVCEKAVNNGYIAPGTWTSSEWFGVQDDMAKNIEQKGYYIYSSAVSKQSAADRGNRIAPLIKIAVKESGAIHSTNVIVTINE